MIGSVGETLVTGCEQQHNFAVTPKHFKGTDHSDGSRGAMELRKRAARGKCKDREELQIASQGRWDDERTFCVVISYMKCEQQKIAGML